MHTRIYHDRSDFGSCSLTEVLSGRNTCIWSPPAPQRVHPSPSFWLLHSKPQIATEPRQACKALLCAIPLASKHPTKPVQAPRQPGIADGQTCEAVDRALSTAWTWTDRDKQTNKRPPFRVRASSKPTDPKGWHGTGAHSPRSVWDLNLT
jgi:hypothetical protein